MWVLGTQSWKTKGPVPTGCDVPLELFSMDGAAI